MRIEKPPLGAVFFRPAPVPVVAVIACLSGLLVPIGNPLQAAETRQDDADATASILVDDAPAGRLDWQDCPFDTSPDWPELRCGVLTVPQDYADPAHRQAARDATPGMTPLGNDNLSRSDSRLVRLPLLYVQPHDVARHAVPLVVAGGGGPGYALGITDDAGRFSADEALWNTWYASTLDAGRPLILIDNRGVGSARPRLDCVELELAELEGLSRHADDALERLQHGAIAACRERLLAEGVDLANFQSLYAARDLEVLRRLLALPDWHVYGASYGSRVALVYEQLFPASTRTLVLDGAYPPGIASYEHAPRQDYLTLRRAFALCASEPACDRRTGGLALLDGLEPFLDRIAREPLAISITHPLTDEPLAVQVDAELLLSALWSLSYDADALARIPRIVSSILKGNTDLLADLVREQVADSVATDSLDEAAYASYHCHDELPFSDFALAEAELDNYPLQHHMNRRYFQSERDACRDWGIAPASDTINTPFRIDTPVLVLSGTLDPVTPPAWGELVVNRADIGWHRVWPGIGHGVLATSACADWTVAAFLDEPTTDPFTLECLDEPPYNPFAAY